MKLSKIDVKEDTNHYESEKINGAFNDIYIEYKINGAFNGAFNDIYIEYKIKVDENNQLNNILKRLDHICVI